MEWSEGNKTSVSQRQRAMVEALKANRMTGAWADLLGEHVGAFGLKGQGS